MFLILKKLTRSAKMLGEKPCSDPSMFMKRL